MCTGNSKSVLKDKKNLRLPVSPPVRGNVKFKRTKRYNNKENIKVGKPQVKNRHREIGKLGPIDMNLLINGEMLTPTFLQR